MLLKHLGSSLKKQTFSAMGKGKGKGGSVATWSEVVGSVVFSDTRPMTSL